MIVKEESNGISYKEIPEALLQRKIGSLKAAYIYVKMCMLVGRTYCREAWVTNPINHQREMSIDCLSDLTARLERAGLIRIAKQDVDTQYKANRYEIVPLDSRYKPVMHDFINHTELSADAKGVGILLGLLKTIPKSYSAIGKAIGINGKTVKVYLEELVQKGIFDPESRQLNVDCFPFWKQVNDKKMKPLIDTYNQAVEEFQTTDDTPSDAGKLPKILDWIRSLNTSIEIQALLYRQAEAGLIGRKTQDKRKAASKQPSVTADNIHGIRL